MAKSIVLYGVFLGAVICFCNYLSGLSVSSYQQSALSCRPEKWWMTVGRGNPVSEVRGAGDEVGSGEWSVTGGECGEHYEESYIRDQIKQIYSAEIGVREKTGKNDGQRVEEYLAVLKLGKGYAWCAAFVSWVFAEAGFPQPRTPWSPSLFPKSRVVWEYLQPNTSRLKPAQADVFGIYFANLKRIAHVGFVDEWGDKYVITVEGVRP